MTSLAEFRKAHLDIISAFEGKKLKRLDIENQAMAFAARDAVKNGKFTVSAVEAKPRAKTRTCHALTWALALPTPLSSYEEPSRVWSSAVAFVSYARPCCPGPPPRHQARVLQVPLSAWEPWALAA